MKRFNLSAWAVSHPTLVLFLMLMLGVAGFFSYEKLGRAEDPFFTVKVVNVSVLWPGATAQEMQAQVADPIEKKIQELPYFEKVQTYSKPGFAALQVTFRDDTPPKDVPHLFYLLRKKVIDVQGQLPSGILGPVVNDEFSDVDSILYMMTGDGADYAQLKKVSEGFRQRLLKVPGVTKVDVYGNQDERIFVEFSHAKLATLGITPQALFDSLAKQNNVTPAGTVETSSQRVPLRVTGARSTAPRPSPKPRWRATVACSALAISPPSPTAMSIRRASSSARKARPRSASASSPPRGPTSLSSARTSRRRPRSS
jgi:multidrug efflux pump